MQGPLAVLLGLPAAMWAAAFLTAVSGVAVRMYETHVARARVAATDRLRARP